MHQWFVEAPIVWASVFAMIGGIVVAALPIGPAIKKDQAEYGFKSLEKLIDEQNEKIDKQDKKIDKQDEKIDKLQKEIDGLRATRDDLTAENTDLRNCKSRLREELFIAKVYGRQVHKRLLVYEPDATPPPEEITEHFSK